MSAHEKCKTMIGPNRFYKLPDFNRSNAWKMLAAVFKVVGVLLKERPAAVQTTGAAPGLLTIVVAKFLFRNTIWIDSVANVKTMSGCGHVARNIAMYVYGLASYFAFAWKLILDKLISVKIILLLGGLSEILIYLKL